VCHIEMMGLIGVCHIEMMGLIGVCHIEIMGLIALSPLLLSVNTLCHRVYVTLLNRGTTKSSVCYTTTCLCIAYSICTHKLLSVHIY
jgi:hypothetical protein